MHVEGLQEPLGVCVGGFVAHHKARCDLPVAEATGEQVENFILTGGEPGTAQVYGDKIDASDKDKIEAAVKDLEETLKGDDTAAIEAKTEALMTASQKLGEKVYADMQAQQAAAGASAGPAGAEAAKPADDNVVDAEVKEVKKG